MDNSKQSVYECDLIYLSKIKDRSGNITPIENSKDIPFDIRRIFYLYDIPGGESRGAHAHKQWHQFLVAASGSFEVLLDDGKIKRQILLNRPDIGLHIPPGIWASEVNFSSGSICLVLASHNYDEEDYIRNYSDFLSFSNKGSNLDFVEYTLTILEKSWNWLNDPEIKMLTATPNFTRESQLSWFQSLKEKQNYYVRGIIYNDIIIGVVGLKHIDLELGSAEYFGYIGEKEYWNKGLSRTILKKIVQKAFEEYSLKSIYLLVKSDNIRAIRAYTKFGFSCESSEADNFMVKMKYNIYENNY